MNHVVVDLWNPRTCRHEKRSHKTLARKRSYKGYYRFYISGTAYRVGTGKHAETFSMHVNSRNKQSVAKLCLYVARELTNSHPGEPGFKVNEVVVECYHSVGA